MKQTRSKYQTIRLMAVLLTLALAITMPIASAKAQEVEQTMEGIWDWIEGVIQEIPELADLTAEEINEAQAAQGAQDLMGGETTLTAENFNAIVGLAEQLQVGMDALIPSISGCIQQADGTPMGQVAVIAIEVPGVLLPVIGITRGAEGTAFVSIGGVSLATVNFEWLSPSQKANWIAHNRAGCYWIPLPPALAGQVPPTYHVMPVLPQYEVGPPAKSVTYNPNGIQIMDLSGLFGDVLSSQAVTPD